MKKLIILPVVIIFVLSSCASLRYVQKEEDVLKIVSLINQKDKETLTIISEVPFLFDGEILMLRGDVQTLWGNSTGAGFEIVNPAVLKIEETREETYKALGEAMEIKAYFSKYLPETARIVHVAADNVNILFLLNDKVDGYAKIYGIKVY